METAVKQSTCGRCQRVLTGNRWIFLMKSAAGDSLNCVRCAMTNPALLKRSAKACLIVGTILTLLNQGDNLIAGEWSNSFYWKIPLTYATPFLVSAYGALSAARR